MSKEKRETNIIMRHILEVRFETKSFAFSDIRGHIIDSFIKYSGSNYIKMSPDGTNFEAADKDKEHIYFFSIGNFGFQIECKKDFKSFLEKTNFLLAFIKQSNAYEGKYDYVRIGTKSTILFNKKGLNFHNLKNFFRDKMVGSHDFISGETKSSIVDSSTILDIDLDNNMSKVTLGPVTMDEAILKFFNNQELSNKYKREFNRDSGILIEIDVFGKDVSSIEDSESLLSQIKSQVSDIENVLTGFKKLFLEE